MFGVNGVASRHLASIHRNSMYTITTALSRAQHSVRLVLVVLRMVRCVDCRTIRWREITVGWRINSVHDERGVICVPWAVSLSYDRFERQTGPVKRRVARDTVLAVRIFFFILSEDVSTTCHFIRSPVAKINKQIRVLVL